MAILDPQEYCNTCWDKTKQYVEGVRNGDIVVGRYIKLFIERYSKMLKDKDKYEFKTDKVDKVYKFFSFLNVEHKNSYVQFPLLPWQCLFLSYIFGFYFKNEERRVVREAFLFIGRKNGKTAFAAAIQLYGMLGDGVAVPQSLLLANTSAQASISLNFARDIVNHSKALSKRLRSHRSRVMF